MFQNFLRRYRNSNNEIQDVEMTDKLFEEEINEYLKEGKTKFNNIYSTIHQDNYKKNLNDFVLYQCLGSGAFAQVYLAREKAKIDQFVAMKLLNKRKLIADHQEEHAVLEKRILSSIDFPFIIKLHYGFQDPTYLCMALEFVQCGELFVFLRCNTYFNETVSRFYCAQVLLALEYLHHLEIAYRDLKPENILIDDNGYLKIADFGFAKLVANRTYTLCGTPEYLAPEIIQSKGYGRAVDWWAFGVLVYELAAGHSPYVSDQIKRIYEKILKNKPKFPAHFSKELRSLIKKLLETDASKRIGGLTNKAEEIREQKWFCSQVEWRELFHKTIPPPKEFVEFKNKRSFKVGNITNITSEKIDVLAKHFAEF